jgi:hypothetical protein
LSPPLPLPQEAQTDWDRRINELLARLAYFKAVCSTYEARDVFPGQTLLLTQRTAEAAALSGPAGVWRRIAQLVRPVAVHVLQAGCGAAVAQQVQRILWEVVHRCAVKPSAAAAAVAARGVGGVGGWVRAGGGGAGAAFSEPPKNPPRPQHPTYFGPSWPSARRQQEVGSSGIEGMALSLVSPGAHQLPSSGADSPVDTVAVVQPLNRLCPERR